jgi:hypothetical protein
VNPLPWYPLPCELKEPRETIFTFPRLPLIIYDKFLTGNLAYRECKNTESVETPGSMYLHAVLERAEVTDLCTENEVSKLCVRKEDDEEHDSKSSNIFGTLSKTETIK